MTEVLAGILMPLSPRQRDLLDFMWVYFKRNDMLPTCNDCCRHFGWKSPNAAHEHYYAPASKGYIEKNESAVGLYRFTRMFHAEQEAANGQDSE